ncbi:MAG: hypothetical protein QXE79_04680 [Candidatus Bathyarchaeia archaeon]
MPEKTRKNRKGGKSPSKPREPIVSCSRCGRMMTLASQGLKWRSYICRICGIGRVESIPE